MGRLLYGLGCVVMVAACIAMALLPRLAPSLWLFGLTGAVLSSLIAGSWLLLSATAGDWPRPRVGYLLIAAGTVASLAGVWTADWLALSWALINLATGLGVTYPLFVPRRGRTADGRSGPVRGPLGRRQQI